jgi:hypothetical protein
MYDQLLDVVFMSAMIRIRNRKNKDAKQIIWFRIRPDKPRDVDVEEIARSLEIDVRRVRQVESDFLNEVSEMNDLLFHFIDRADRILEFRRLTEQLEEEVERCRGETNDSTPGCWLARMSSFFAGRGSALVGEATAIEMIADLDRIKEEELTAGLADLVEIHGNFAVRCRLLLDLVTPEPLPKV